MARHEYRAATGSRHHHASVDDEPLTVPIAGLPVPRPAPAVEVASRGHSARSTAVGVATTVGSVALEGGAAIGRRVRAVALSRWPSPVPGADIDPVPAPVVVGTSPPSVLDHRRPVAVLPVLALLVCAGGIAGLVMPVVEVGRFASFAVIDIPYVGMGSLGVFVLFTLLPVIDVLRRRVSLTAWLLVPALVGLVPVAAVVFAVPWLPKALHLLWEAAPESMIEVGAAGPTLGAADALLVVIGVAAIVHRVRGLRRRVRGR